MNIIDTRTYGRLGIVPYIQWPILDTLVRLRIRVKPPPGPPGRGHFRPLIYPFSELQFKSFTLTYLPIDKICNAIKLTQLYSAYPNVSHVFGMSA